MSKYLTKIEYRVLSEFKRKLNRELPGEVLDLKLFGSKARGDFHKGSDIDILIVLKNLNKRNKDIIIDLSTEMLLKYGIDISTHIYSQKEFDYLNSIPTVFMQIFEKEAISL